MCLNEEMLDLENRDAKSKHSLNQALLVVNAGADFKELFRMARLLKQSGEYTPLFFFGRIYPTIDRDVTTCYTEGIVCLDAAGKNMIVPGVAQADVQSKLSTSSKQTLKLRLKRFLSSLLDLLRMFRRDLYKGMNRKANFLFCPFFLMYYFRRLRYAHQLINQLEPDILIFPEENVGYVGSLGVFIKAGHEHGVPSVIIPYTIANALEPAEALFYNPACTLRRRSNRLFGALYPHWVYKHKGRRLLRLPAAEALAIELLGLAPPLPWIMNSGYADAIVVESDFMFEYYRREGLPADRLIVTGSLYHDVFKENLQNVSVRRATLYGELGFPAGRPMILGVLPPNQFPRQECEFDTYDEMVRFWVQSLSAIDGYNTVIALHPRAKYEEMRYVEQWGVKIVRKDTADLIPLCDIFIATASATIRWAIACGKAVVNYDVYRYKYTDFAEVGGVITVEEKTEFRSAVRRLTDDQEFYADIVARQKASSASWGRFDGCAAERILQLFDQLIEQRGLSDEH